MADTDDATQPQLTPAEKRARFGDGPWLNEPDRVEWYAHGLPALITRHPRLGHLCGYVAVPPGHPLHGVERYDDDAIQSLGVHCGVNYASACSGGVCHVPRAGEPDDVWWFGFDCGHAWDLSPGLAMIFAEAALDHTPPVMRGEVYRDLAFARRECESLARQLSDMQGAAR